jgi:tetraacyldisaccharide 4'-kinase
MAKRKKMTGRIQIHINKVLLPLAWLYGCGVWVRNCLFDRGILRSETFSVPVISVGNLAAGGTGKTPHTEFLVRLLAGKYRVAVLSRGYKRSSHGFALVAAGASARTVGDEPMQLFRKFPDILVAVDGNRRRGIRRLLHLPENKKPEVIVLDDAFQHRYVKPSLSLLLTDSRRPFFDDCLLPAGRLREPARNYERADMVLFTKCSEQTLFPVKLDKPLFYTAFEYKGLLPVFPTHNSIKKESIERLKKESYSFLLVAGLANPSDLIAYARLYTNDLHTMIFPDHHAFSRRDVGKIRRTFKAIASSRKVILVSEKDAVRLAGQAGVAEDLKKFMFYVPVEVVVREGDLFTLKIEEHVKNFARDRIVAEAADTGGY